jgi:hypothetical protein
MITDRAPFEVVVRHEVHVHLLEIVLRRTCQVNRRLQTLLIFV